jgi:hypothetical protein
MADGAPTRFLPMIFMNSWDFRDTPESCARDVGLEIAEAR